jgi:hypothetical protein
MILLMKNYSVDGMVIKDGQLFLNIAMGAEYFDDKTYTIDFEVKRYDCWYPKKIVVIKPYYNITKKEELISFEELIRMKNFIQKSDR